MSTLGLKLLIASVFARCEDLTKLLRGLACDAQRLGPRAVRIALDLMVERPRIP